MPRFSPQRLRSLRESARLSRDQLAHRLGRSVGAYIAYEQGRITPPVHVLERLAEVYGVGVGELFDPGDPTDPVTAFATEIRALVDTMPPLSPEQAARLRVILRGVA